MLYMTRVYENNFILFSFIFITENEYEHVKYYINMQYFTYYHYKIHIFLLK
jgi:hypothetical protein